MTNSNHQTGMAGTYLVAAQLTLNGFVATITSRNAQDVDILVYHPETNRTYSIQVKTTADANKQMWTMDNLKKSKNLFYVFVVLQKDNNHLYYVINSEDIPKMNNAKDSTWRAFTRDERYINNWELLKK